jgi:ABC-type transport system substrate-binding protein
MTSRPTTAPESLIGIDRLIDLQREEMDLVKRNEILKQIDTRLTQIVPYVLLCKAIGHGCSTGISSAHRSRCR